MPDSTLGMVSDSLYALMATYLATSTRDIGAFTSIPRDAETKHRYFVFEGVKMLLAQRPHGGIFVAPGVNLYIGDQIAIRRKTQPQRWVLPAFIHVLVPYTDEPLVGDKRAKRISEAAQDAFEGCAGRQRLYDFSSGSPSPTDSFVSWAKLSRGAWRELGDPNTEPHTNRQRTFEVLYAR